jgi:hypothetical protein
MTMGFFFFQRISIYIEVVNPPPPRQPCSSENADAHRNLLASYLRSMCDATKFKHLVTSHRDPRHTMTAFHVSKLPDDRSEYEGGLTGGSPPAVRHAA